jgi:hypothetical protein
MKTLIFNLKICTSCKGTSVDGIAYPLGLRASLVGRCKWTEEVCMCPHGLMRQPSGVSQTDWAPQTNAPRPISNQNLGGECRRVDNDRIRECPILLLPGPSHQCHTNHSMLESTSSLSTATPPQHYHQCCSLSCQRRPLWSQLAGGHTFCRCDCTHLPPISCVFVLVATIT